MDASGCLDHLLSWVPFANRPALGVLLASGAAVTIRREMARIGIEPAPRGLTGYFGVAYTRQCRPLARHFADTPWDVCWAAALQQVQGARRSRQSIWTGSTSSKAVMIPYAIIAAATENNNGGNFGTE
ncbi:MAG: hypothetical protein VB101_04200 [Rhodospirillaceae bacterium]|nr:hypothetical protein [Rhodospirillaceae bacterium]